VGLIEDWSDVVSARRVVVGVKICLCFLLSLMKIERGKEWALVCFYDCVTGWRLKMM
jgi:hypothetical protein